MSRSPARQRGGQGTPGRPHAATTGPGCPPGAAKSPVPFGGAALPWDGVVLAGDTDPWAHPKPGPSPSSVHPGCLHGEELFFFLPLGTCAHGVPTTLRPPELNSPEGFSLFRQPRASSPKTKAPRANPGNRKAHGDGDIPITTGHRGHLCSHRGVLLVPSPRRPSAALNPLQTPQSPHRGVEDEQTNEAGIKPGARGAAPARGWFYFLPHFSSGRPPFP